jgi:hypothetical protein
MASRGLPNSRMKDFYDVYALIKTCDINTGILGDAIAATFGRRKKEIPAKVPIALTDEFAVSDVKKTQWHSFVEKNELSLAPEDLGIVLAEIRRLVLPVFADINRKRERK